jgi:hypothetical protein
VVLGRHSLYDGAMARAEEARCLYCNGKVPLLRKLTNGQFCSKEHQKDYWKEQERLAVEVLHRTHDALRAFQVSQEDADSILGSTVQWNPEPEVPQPVTNGHSHREAAYPAPATPPPTYQTPTYQAPPTYAEPVRHDTAYQEPRGRIVTEPPPMAAPPPPMPVRAPEPEIEPPMAGFAPSGTPDTITPAVTALVEMFAIEPVPVAGTLASTPVLGEAGEPLHTVLPVHDLPSAEMMAVPMMLALLAQTMSEAAPLPGHVGAPLLLSSDLALETPELTTEYLDRIAAEIAAAERAAAEEVAKQQAAEAAAKQKAADQAAAKLAAEVAAKQKAAEAAAAKQAAEAAAKQKAADEAAAKQAAEVAAKQKAAAEAAAKQAAEAAAKQKAAAEAAAKAAAEVAAKQAAEAAAKAAAEAAARQAAEAAKQKAAAEAAAKQQAAEAAAKQKAAADAAARQKAAAEAAAKKKAAAAELAAAQKAAAEKAAAEAAAQRAAALKAEAEAAAARAAAEEAERAAEEARSLPPFAVRVDCPLTVRPIAAAAPIVPVSEPVFLAPPMFKPVMPLVRVDRVPQDRRTLERIPLAPAARPVPTPRQAEPSFLVSNAPTSSNAPEVLARATPSLDAHLRLAGGCRYAMQLASSRTEHVPYGPEEFILCVDMVEYPTLISGDWRSGVKTNFIPPPSGMITIRRIRAGISPKRRARGRIARPQQEGQPVAFDTPAWLPWSGLMPQEWKNDVAPAPMPHPAAMFGVPLDAAPSSPEALLSSTMSNNVMAEPRKGAPQVLKVVAGFWNNAPRDLRLLIFAIPALLALAFHPTLPKVHVSTVQATEPVQKNVGEAVNGSWATFKQAVSERAAVGLDEDFRQGLDDWASPGGEATEWSFDANGFVRPGTLALYSPSLPLTDYQAQFLAIIDKKALSWVVRAADFDNYYVVKLVVLKPGPLTTLGLTRYAVINGQAQNRVDSAVPLTARPDMIYRVRMDVHDDSFALMLQGQMVDAWSEPRLKRGGIGFFSARGEVSRVRWVQVTHQYDMLGRLCSYLAPYDLSASTETQTNNGSWKP